MDLTVVEIAVSVMLSLSVSGTAIAIAWGKISNQVNNNKSELCELKNSIKEVNDKLIPVDKENTRNDVLMGELLKALAAANQQIESLKEIVADLKTEVEILKDKHKKN